MRRVSWIIVLALALSGASVLATLGWPSAPTLSGQVNQYIGATISGLAVVMLAGILPLIWMSRAGFEMRQCALPIALWAALVVAWDLLYFVKPA